MNILSALSESCLHCPLTHIPEKMLAHIMAIIIKMLSFTLVIVPP